ncbi:MAG: tetratricopeptide repeat protein [Pirellulales bacterium]
MPPETPTASDHSDPTAGDVRPRATSDPEPGQSARQATAWIERHPATARGMLAAGLLSALLTAAVVRGLLFSGGEKKVTAEQVLQALDDGAPARTKDLAKRLRDQPDTGPEDMAAATYALGVVAAQEAEEAWGRRRGKKFLVAARYLEEARDRGFPPDRRGRGLSLLGRSLYESGRLPDARSVLLAALRAAPEEPGLLYRLLADTYHHDRPPDLDKALHYNTLHLSHKTGSPPRDAGLLQRARILLDMDKPDQGLQTLGRIPKDSRRQAEATVLRARIAMDEGERLNAGAEPTPQDLQRARRQYRKAIEMLRVAQGLDTLTNRATRKAMYLIGLCFERLEDHRAALKQFARTRQLFPDAPEATASSYRQARIALRLGRGDDVVAAVRRTVKGLDDPQRYDNPWLPLKQLRRGLLEAYRHYMATNNFTVALKLAKLFPPVFPETEALKRAAEVHRQWGQSLLSRAEQQPPGDAEAFRRRGRLHFREAGRLHRRLAKLLITRRAYPEQLWQAADNYMRGQGFGAAVDVLLKYLKDQSRKRHPQALVLLGRAHLALGEIDQALDVLTECTEFYPRDAAAYEARLLASRAYQEQGEPQRAELLLLKNLAGEHLTPASIEWRDSLFDLGELLLRRDEYERASRRLEEAVARYPDHSRAVEARYLLAESYRRAAKAAQKKRRRDLAGAPRLASTKRIDQQMQKALDQYIALRDRLGEKQQEARLSPLDRAILRNTDFAVGDIQFELASGRP